MANSISASRSKNTSIVYNTTVIEEIALLDIYISMAVADNNVSATLGTATSIIVNDTVVTGSKMTSDSVIGRAYHSAFQGTITDYAKTSEMGSVIKHFTDLGYSVNRQSNGTVFSWVLTWY